jgi:hypothetical protein
MLADIPLSLALDFDRGRVDQPVQRIYSSTIRDGDAQGLLATTQGAEFRHFPVKACQSLQAFDEPSPLAKRHAEPYFHRETNLYRRIAELQLPPALAGPCRLPGHLPSKPDR